MELRDEKLYYVGGAVRDEIMGVPSLDTDYCYEGNAIAFAERNGLDIKKRNPDFGTVRVLIDGKEVDIASTREEIYPEAGKLPVIKRLGCSLRDDLRRRDFSVNSIAKNTVTGEFYDPFEGESDIERKTLRVLHEMSFVDDPTRIVRGLKFSVRFGFELEEETYELQKGYLENINYDISWHRLKKELVETFNLNKGEAFDKFVDQNIYRLLGKNQHCPNVCGEYIERAVTENKVKVPWIIYLSFFDLSNLPLTRVERRIIEGAERLRTSPGNNNIQHESEVIYGLKNGE